MPSVKTGGLFFAIIRPSRVEKNMHVSEQLKLNSPS
jgi:hypothetical protein